MHFAEFFTSFSLLDINKETLFCFTSKSEYPLLFFYFLKKRIVEVAKHNICSIQLDETSIADVERMLQSSLLGMSMWYWFCDISDIDAKKRDAFLTLAASYKGPHVLLFFIQKDKLVNYDHIPCIELPKSVTKQEAYMIAEWLSIHNESDKLVDLLYQHNKVQGYTVEEICKGLWYLLLAGSSRTDFMREQLSLVIEPQMALFELTTNFFAKKRSLFFAHWKQIQGAYSFPFWTAFWFEQLWRAHFYIKSMHAGDRVEAKKISFRLPFSFINNDWKKYSLHHCAHACETLYRIDQKTKMGSDGSELDLFFSQFFG